MAGLDNVLLAAAVLIVAGVFASKASDRLGVPALLLFLALGMLAGSEGPGGIWFDNAGVAQLVGVTALAFILFAGGLETPWRDAAPVLWTGIALATIGNLATAGLVGWFASSMFGFGWKEGLLLGSILSSTDAAAVFAVLRSRGAGLKGRLRPLLELESGSNDPMAVFLTLSFILLIQHPETPLISLAPRFLWQMGVGAAAGYGAGRASVWLINRADLAADGLYPVLTIGLALLIYALVSTVGGNGFLAVYIAGLVMGNRQVIHRGTITRFHNGLAWLMQIAMFLTLGLLVFPSHLAAVAAVGAGVALFLIFVARPAAVFLTLLPARMPLREKTLVAWVGLRGAAPIILATFPLVAAAPGAETYFNVVFFAVLASVLLQGTTIPLVAGWLGVREDAAPRRAPPLEFVPAVPASSALTEVVVPPGSPVAGRRLVSLRLPPTALVVLIARGDEYVVPRGGTAIEAGDVLMVLADEPGLSAVRAMVESPPVS
jgi:cell volume regulation protein A